MMFSANSRELQVDETFVKKTDIVMATDAEVDAMLTEVFGAQATV